MGKLCALLAIVGGLEIGLGLFLIMIHAWNGADVRNRKGLASLTARKMYSCDDTGGSMPTQQGCRRI